MAKIVYLRTDKNGTKYYANYTCPRCGGAGGSDKWAFTGWTCYECGGTGESPTPVIEKEYTPEYRAKLDERARKRAEAKRAVKKAVNPLYGKKGVGLAKNPKRAVKNAVYKKTTVGVKDLLK